MQSGEGINTQLDQATIARVLIRESVDSFISEKVPELHSIFITKAEALLFKSFSGEDQSLDQEMLGGLISSIDSIGNEMFSDGDDLGSVNLGGYDIMVQHREKFNFGFIIGNLDPNTSTVIIKDVRRFSDEFFKLIIKDDYLDEINDLAESIYQEFFEKYS